MVLNALGWVVFGLVLRLVSLLHLLKPLDRRGARERVVCEGTRFERYSAGIVCRNRNGAHVPSLFAGAKTRPVRNAYRMITWKRWELAVNGG